MNKQKGSMFFTIILGVAIITVLIIMIAIAANGVKNKQKTGPSSVQENLQK